MPGFELPTGLACGSDLDPAWIARLPRIVAGLARRWSLEVGPPFQPGGCASWVAPARTGTGERVVLLCTDLHPDNVLAAAREPWLAIDPKPYVGDPAYDTLQQMLNFPGRLAADPAGLARRMAGLLDLDADRVRLWLFARCVQESVCEPDLRTVAVQLAP